MPAEETKKFKQTTNEGTWCSLNIPEEEVPAQTQNLLCFSSVAVKLQHPLLCFAGILWAHS